MLCSCLSFLRKQESQALNSSALWMPDQVRHDESVLAGYNLS